MKRQPASETAQLELWPDPPPITWCVPVDKYGRDLPPIALVSDNWKPVYVWGHLAVKAAEDLGPDASVEQLYHATTEARHLYYALTGERAQLNAELAWLGQPAV